MKSCLSKHYIKLMLKQISDFLSTKSKHSTLPMRCCHARSQFTCSLFFLIWIEGNKFQSGSFQTSPLTHHSSYCHQNPNKFGTLEHFHEFATKHEPRVSIISELLLCYMTAWILIGRQSFIKTLCNGEYIQHDSFSNV